MRLIKRSSDGGYTFVTANESSFTTPYAILSHTWGADEEELSYQDIENGRRDKSLAKLEFTLLQAAQDGLQHVWLDTCCINKWSSTELNEAINSMFKWYANAQVCYAYLVDVPTVVFDNSRWFTRGWTLQELIAPQNLEFYDGNGQRIASRQELAPRISLITGISAGVLQSRVIDHIPHAERLRWAAVRQTKKAEDMVYCLLGLLGISMSMMYGEDIEDTRRRLFSAVDDKYGRPVGDTLRAATPSADAGTPLRVITEEALLDSLRFDRMGSRRENIDLPYPGTCDWLLQHPKYTSWLTASYSDTTEHVGTPGFIWIKGHPGAGKSTLIKFADSQAPRMAQDRGLQLSFYFNARGEPLERSVEGLYRTLLVQLIRRERYLQSSACRYLEGVDARFTNGKMIWEVRQLQNVLADTIDKVKFRHIRCYIDALDECDVDDIKQMVNFFDHVSRPIFRQTRFSVCFASRYYPALSIRNCTELRLDEHKEHIGSVDRYVRLRLDLEDDENSLQLKEEVITKARGVFMWAVLVTNILNDEIMAGRVYHLRALINSLPLQLDGIYKELAVRHNDDDQSFHLAMQLLYFSDHGLTGEEYYFALLYAKKQVPAFSSRLITPTAQALRRFVSSTSRGLAELILDQDKNYVQFIHESVRDFLSTPDAWKLMRPDVSEDIAEWSHGTISLLLAEVLSDLCDPSTGALLSYLDSPQIPAYEYSELLLQKMPLLEMICQSFLPHLELSSEALRGQLLKSVAWLDLVRLEQVTAYNVARDVSSPLGLLIDYQALRLADMVFTLDDEGLIDDLLGRHPVAETVRLLISKSQAYRARHEMILQNLLNRGWDVNQPDNWGNTALSYLFQMRPSAVDVGMIELLLSHGADPNTMVDACMFSGESWESYTVYRYQTPVIMLCIRSNEVDVGALFHKESRAILENLLSKGASIDAQRTVDGRTALMDACAHCKSDDLEVLLKSGANANCKSKDGRTALFLVGEQKAATDDLDAELLDDAPKIVESLLQHGADPHATDEREVSALSFWAAQSAYTTSRQLHVLLILLAYGADPTVADGTGHSALVAALRTRNIPALAILLRPGWLNGSEEPPNKGAGGPREGAVVELSFKAADIEPVLLGLRRLERVHDEIRSRRDPPETILGFDADWSHLKYPGEQKQLRGSLS